jgi:chromate transporter
VINQPAYTINQLVLYFLKLGTTGFGGPIALVSSMHQHLVEEKKWISEEDYKQGLVLSQLAPGPLAAQLAIYIGYIHYRIIGATLAGIAFVLPSFIMVLALGWVYIRYQGMNWIQTAFYGVGAAVIGIIGVSSYKLTIKTIGSNWFMLCLFLLSASITLYLKEENILVIIYSGLIYMFVKAPPKIKIEPPFVFVPIVSILSNLTFNSKWAKIAWFFTKAGAFVFGSGLAIVPFLYGGVVKEYQWLNEQQFLDAVAVAMITPGPIIITVGFIGYLIDGLSGAIVASLATFIPCYLFTIIPAPYFKKYGEHPSLKAFIDGVTAAAIGAIAGAVIILGSKQLTDITSITITLISILMLILFKKIKEPYLIVAAALIAFLIKLL